MCVLFSLFILTFHRVHHAYIQRNNYLAFLGILKRKSLPIVGSVIGIHYAIAQNIMFLSQQFRKLLNKLFIFEVNFKHKNCLVFTKFSDGFYVFKGGVVEYTIAAMAAGMYISFYYNIFRIAYIP